MAISVKHFKNELDCEEPGFEVGVSYHSDFATGASEICNGNGTLTNVYGDFNNLGDIITNVGSVFNEGESDICLNGIDVIFNIDYTGSMDDAIAGVRDGVVDISTQLASLSNNNYRIGVVLYDETTLDTGHTLNYADSVYYQNIPAAQKLTLLGTDRQHFTCIAKMTTTGNLTEIQNAMNAIGSTSNTSTTMKLGNGGGMPEPGGLSTYEIVANQFAGSFRADVLKLVINITDALPGGDNDNFSYADETAYFQNTLTPLLDANNVQFYNNTSQSNAATDATYAYLAENTTPSGISNEGLDFSVVNGSGEYTWTTNIIDGLTELCEITTMYTCDPAPAGWYAAVPVVQGTTVVYYWDGTAWIDSYSCPDPLYTIQIQYIDAITNGSVEGIPLNHPNYGGASSIWEFTGMAGSTHTATIGCNADPGYTNLSVNVSNISDNSIITSTSVNGGTDEVTFVVTMPPSNQPIQNFTISGSASQIVRTMTVTVINNIFDTINENGEAQNPPGQVDPTPVTPGILGWTELSAYYGTYARRYEFTGVAGSTHEIDVNFEPAPADYTLDVTGIVSTFEITEGGGANAAVQGAFSNFTLVTGADSSWAGIFTMPASDGFVTIKPQGSCDQTIMRYTLKASETIIGAEMAPGDESNDFFGYTGDVFNLEVDVIPSSGYENANTTSVQLDTAYDQNAAISNLNNTGTGATLDITMPSGGGMGGIIFSGAAALVENDYVINIADNSPYVLYPVHTFTGEVNTAHTVTIEPLTDPGFIYTRQSFSVIGESPANSSTVDWTTNDVNDLRLTITLDGTGMPTGGGETNIVVNLQAQPILYTYSLNVVTDNNVIGSYSNDSVTITAAEGSTTSGNFNFNQNADYTYTATDVSSSDPNASGTLIAGDIPGVNYTVVMPNGGGNGTLTVNDAVATQNQHTFTIYLDDSELTGGNVTSNSPIVITSTIGITSAWALDLDPSPAYWDIDITDANSITIYGEGGAGDPAPEVVLNANNPQPDSFDVITGYVTMPNGGGSAWIRPKGSVSEPQYEWKLNFYENIPNLTLGATQYTLGPGFIGSSHGYVLDIIPSPGYSAEITNVTLSNDAGGNLTWSVDANEDVVFDLAGMPQGGGFTDVTIFGSSTQDIFTANMTYTDNSANGEFDYASETFTGVAGSVHVIDNYWRVTTSGQIMESNSFVHTGGSTISNETATNTPDDSRFQAVFTMPIGGANVTITAKPRTETTTTLATFDCQDANFQMIQGGTPGAPSQGTTSAGIIAQIAPTTYQYGTTTYIANITVPDGYTNTGDKVSCPDAATSDTTTTTTTDPCIAANCSGGVVLTMDATDSRAAGQGQVPIGTGEINAAIPKTCASEAGMLSFTLDDAPVTHAYTGQTATSWNFRISNVGNGTYSLKPYNSTTGCEGEYTVTVGLATTTTTSQPAVALLEWDECGESTSKIYINKNNFASHFGQLPGPDETVLYSGTCYEYSSTVYTEQFTVDANMTTLNCTCAGEGPLEEPEDPGNPREPGPGEF